MFARSVFRDFLIISHGQNTLEAIANSVLSFAIEVKRQREEEGPVCRSPREGSKDANMELRRRPHPPKLTPDLENTLGLSTDYLPVFEPSVLPPGAICKQAKAEGRAEVCQCMYWTH